MNLLILADMDDFHWPHGGGQADLLLACGDVADQVILEAAQAYGVTRILAVKGNHDADAAFASPIENLHLTVVEHGGGLRIGGCNGCWKYKPRGAFLYDQAEAHRLLAGFPPVDILITHNSPRGIHDREDGVHPGFDALADYLHRAEPRLLLHGHQHVDRETQIGRTTVVGVHGHRLVKIPANPFCAEEGSS